MLQANPGLEVVGGNFMPSALKMFLAQAIQVGYMVCIALLLAGDHIFPLIGIAPPQAYHDARQNKVR